MRPTRSRSTARACAAAAAARAFRRCIWSRASSQQLVLAQEPVEAKENDCAGILVILKRLTVKGALITIDAIAANHEIAKARADYLLALKSNQPTLHADVEAYFAAAPQGEIETVETIDKDHGRIETRKTSVSRNVGWLLANEDGRYPGHPRFPALTSLVRTVTRTEHRGKTAEQTRLFISSAALTAGRAAQAVRAHWGVGSLHRVLDVVFRDDPSRLRRGHGVHTMALVRSFAFNILRKGKGRRSIKTARKAAGWSPDLLASIVIP